MTYSKRIRTKKLPDIPLPDTYQATLAEIKQVFTSKLSDQLKVAEIASIIAKLHDNEAHYVH